MTQAADPRPADDRTLPDPTRTAADFYARAVEQRGTRPGCCGPALASGYAVDAVRAVPQEAVTASFGCGDPLAAADVRPGDVVLDLGCGAGLDLLLAAGRVGPEGRVIGIDASPEMLARARANAERAGVADRVELHEGRIEALPVADASVDRVISNCVVNLSPDKPAVFREIRRVLKPGGRALISDLVADRLPPWVQAHADLYAACIAGAVSEAAYLALAAEAGLDAEVVDRLTYDEGLVRGLLETALPLPLDDIATRLGLDRTALLAMAARDLAGRITSIRLRLTARTRHA